MKDTVIVAVHGWGFGAGFWLPLVDAIRDAEVVTLDLGFRGRLHMPALSDDGRRRIALGHSLGALWLLTERPFRWDAFVGVNAFARFADCVAPRILDRMVKRLGTDPEGTVADFLALCGSSDHPARLDPVRLEEGLQWLRDRDARGALDSDPAPALILAARKDPLVPPDRLGFPDGIIRWHDTGGHLLPQTEPAWCVAAIEEFLGA